MLQARELFSPRLYFPPVKCLRGNKRLGTADRHTGFDGFRAERREQRREDAAVLEGAERGDVEFGHAAEQRKNAIRFGYPTLHQDVRKPVRRGAERRVAEVANLVVTTNPAQRQLVAATGQDMSVDRLMRDVEPAVGQTIE